MFTILKYMYINYENVTDIWSLTFYLFCFQVSANMGTTSAAPSGHKVTPSLGIAWANLVNTRLMTSRTNRSIQPATGDHSSEVNVRTLEVMFSPHLPNSLCYYIIDQTGVKGLT